MLDAALQIHPNISHNYNLTTTSVPNVDLIMIMIAQPSPNSPIAGYASCVQRDQYQRCTVGLFNWVPEIIDVEGTDAPDVTASELHTAIHEMTHVLGGMNPGTNANDIMFIDDNGLPRQSGVYVVSQDAGYNNKPITYIVTDRVVNVSRTYFDCPTMIGFPLEDVELGKGAHWEARLAGAELMSYGTGAGLVYVSDLTLAYLEV